MCHVRRPRLSPHAVPYLILFVLALLVAPPTLWAGGTPDPGTSPLVEDSGDADVLPDNENQLIGVLGADRGFGFGDYVSDDTEPAPGVDGGLQATIGTDARYQYFIEVPPGQSSLVVEIFDAETGAGDLAGTEEHDQDNTTGWDLVTEYTLLDGDGATIASITLGPQDCDPVTPGNQDACNNAWSDLGTFTVANPTPGHWTLEVFAPNVPAATDYDDNNSFGIRAHDGDASAGGTEYNVYADTYVGVGHVYAPGPASDPGYSRTHDFFPYVTEGCSCDVNDWDSDDNGDEIIDLAPQNPVTGATGAYSFTALSGATNWRQNIATGFTTDADATSFGLWDLRFNIGEFNFITLWMGSESAADPVVPPTNPGDGAEPDQQPEAGAIRLYFPADGSRFFGEIGGADDAVTSPLKPNVGQSWAVISGPDPVLVGATSRVRVTITIDNPAAFPIQFDGLTTDPRVVTAQVPTNAGQTVYVAGSATVNNSGGAASTATSESGAGPWDLTFAPGVVDAGDTITLTYDIDVTPTSLSPPTLAFTGSGGNGTVATYLDETCANGAGGASVCTATAQAGSEYSFGPLCPLGVDVLNAGTPGIDVVKDASVVTDAGGGLFDVTYTVTVTNTGTTNLSSVQVVDDLEAAFTGTATFMVTAGPAASGTLTANAGYNGVADDNLLVAGSSTLLPADSETITYTVRFDPNAEPGPFVNTAAGSAVDPSMTPVSDSDTASAPVGENPGIDVAKSVQGGLVDNGGGSFTVTYQVSVTNTGNVDLSAVQVVDDLTATFTAPASLTSVTVPIATGTLTANVGYNGDGDTDLLVAGSSTLPVGATETITFSATFDAGGSVGPFTNTATGSGTSPQGTNVQDSDTADVSINENPAIDVVKVTQGPPTDNMDGTFTVDYLVTLENTGDVDLSMVSATDNLAAAYPGPASVSSVTTPITSGTLTANAGYNGIGDIELLTDASSTLAVSASGTISYSVTFDPGGQTGPFTNTADGSGQSPAGADVNDSDTADVSVTLGSPVIGLAKRIAGQAVSLNDGNYGVSFIFVVENLGAFDLTDVQVTDDMSLTFPAPASVISASVISASGTLTLNPAYDGVGDINLLIAASSTLPIGALEEIQVDVVFDPANLTRFENSATATGDSPVGTTSDTSDDGVDPDPNGNGNPDEDGENDPTPIAIGTLIGIPTADSLGLTLLGLLLAMIAVVQLRRRG